VGRIVHLTHPKSGSHWVTDVLADPEVLAFVPNITFARCEDYRLEYWAAQPDNYFTGPMFSVTFEEWARTRAPGDKAVYVLRDPRDVIVSWIYSFAVSHESQPHIALIRPILLASDLRHRLMIGAYQYWQSSWIVRSWAGRPVTESEFPTTFEAILSDEFGEFRKIVAFLGWPVPDDVLRKVVEYHTFERRTRGRKRGTTSEYSHYRSGVPGEWRKHFDRKLGEIFENACPNLLAELGYEKNSAWWEDLPERIDILDEEIVPSTGASADVLLEIERLHAERAALAVQLGERAKVAGRLAERLANA
jgi:hypothetical protein